MDNIYEHHILHSLAIAEYLRRLDDAGADSAGPACGSADSAGGPAACGDGSASPAGAGFRAGESVLDLGTGGGFPGIPLAVVYPEVRFTLCDSIGKKVMVAREVAAALGLTNVTCVHSRAEDLPDTFDWVVSRAVTTLDKFYPWVRGRYRRGILVLKGGDIESEIAEFCRKWHFQRVSVRTWPVSEWLQDDYFAEKFVIHI
ncbi:MAG: 16S rRNA (guanine(527)-N(7))-methyltransferase RsmG [Bacteroidales bacterium]|nr:16S rRNA (guanine(527)-N(7))-methyltransferase RsmG [Bacteroidales bacterium]